MSNFLGTVGRGTISLYEKAQVTAGTLLLGILPSAPAMADDKWSHSTDKANTIGATAAVASVAPMLIITKGVTSWAVGRAVKNFKVPGQDPLEGISHEFTTAPLAGFEMITQLLQSWGQEANRLREAGKRDAKIASQERTMGTVVPHMAAGGLATGMVKVYDCTLTVPEVALATLLTALFAERTNGKTGDDHWSYRLLRPALPVIVGLFVGKFLGPGWQIGAAAATAAVLDASSNETAGKGAKIKNKARKEGAIYEKYTLALRNEVIAAIHGRKVTFQGNSSDYSSFGRFGPPSKDQRDSGLVSAERFKLWFVGDSAALDRNATVVPMSATDFATKVRTLENSQSPNEPKRLAQLLDRTAALSLALYDELRAGGFTLQPKV